MKKIFIAIALFYAFCSPSTTNANPIPQPTAIPFGAAIFPGGPPSIVAPTVNVNPYNYSPGDQPSATKYDNDWWAPWRFIEDTMLPALNGCSFVPGAVPSTYAVSLPLTVTESGCVSGVGTTLTLGWNGATPIGNPLASSVQLPWPIGTGTSSYGSGGWTMNHVGVANDGCCGDATTSGLNIWAGSAPSFGIRFWEGNPGTTETAVLKNGNFNISGTFTGNGSGLTNLNATQLTSGTVPSGALGGQVVTTGAQTFTGTKTFGLVNVQQITFVPGAINLTVSNGAVSGVCTPPGSLDINYGANAGVTGNSIYICKSTGVWAATAL